MIDKKTRKKIIKLWKEGENKASIQRKTKVSQPTIRKVIREAGLEKVSITSKGNEDPLDIIEEFDKRLKVLEKESLRLNDLNVLKDEKSRKHIIHNFILNFTQNLPISWAEGNVWKVLSQGIASYAYVNVLNKVLDREVILEIDRKIQEYEPLHSKVFNVVISIIHGEYHVDVNLLMKEG